MNAVMYLFVNRGLGMTPGKAFAQVSHAAVKAFQISKPGISEEWMRRGETKVALLCEDEQHMMNIERYIKDRGFKTVLVIDEGRTEIKPHSLTALGVEVLDKADPEVVNCFEHFHTYKEKKPPKAPKKRKLFGS